ncbi:helix-turn-helix domain-containing protein [Porticoccaceae bacterium]|nr:helix-turn-helix domain-containing protein [Porticoccaceae bacterium]
MESPNKSEIKQARIDAGLSQTEAANLIYKGLRTWQQWKKGDRKMDPAFWELF